MFFFFLGVEIAKQKGRQVMAAGTDTRIFGVTQTIAVNLAEFVLPF